MTVILLLTCINAFPAWSRTVTPLISTVGWRNNPDMFFSAESCSLLIINTNRPFPPLAPMHTVTHAPLSAAHWAANAAFVKAELMNKSGNCQDSVTTWRLLWRLHTPAVRFILQMWTNVRSLQSLHVSISVSTVWAPSVVSVTLDTSFRDTAAWVSHLPVGAGTVTSRCYYQSVTRLWWRCAFLDINECMRNVCPANKECRNTDGGYQCFDSCPAGMTKGETGACVGESSQYFQFRLCLSASVKTILLWNAQNK